ncbi:MAG: 4-hydroxy-tetrahydrodipicolinate reductase [Pyrinomonadaceae bacterium]
MKIVLIGYGSMGRQVETLAKTMGHEIVLAIDSADEPPSGAKLTESGADAAIDFSNADAVRQNVETCVLANLPHVVGTTGWNADKEAIREIVIRKNGAVVHGANFSVGVNLFYRISDYASELFSKFPEYQAFIEEQHHSRKKDAPSGTALRLKELVSRHIDTNFSVSSTRAGNIPGTHRVGFDGAADQILLQHQARSREGFAAGALIAAEWIAGKTGFYDFADVIDEIIESRSLIY